MPPTNRHSLPINTTVLIWNFWLGSPLSGALVTAISYSLPWTPVTSIGEPRAVTLIESFLFFSLIVIIVADSDPEGYTWWSVMLPEPDMGLTETHWSRGSIVNKQVRV